MNAVDLIFAIGDIDDKAIREAGEFLSYSDTATMNHKLRHTWRTVLIAAIIASLLGISAYAAYFFSMHRRPAEPGEKFSISSGVFENAKLVFEFSGPEECPAVEIRPGWLPFEPSESCRSYYCQDGWYSSMIYAWDVPPEGRPEEYRELNDPYHVEVYYAPQFVNGGHAIMLDYTPGEIVESTINGCLALCFNAVLELPGFCVDGVDYPPITQEKNYILLFSEDSGYLLAVYGNADMDVLTRIAENLEVRPLDETVKKCDFEDYNIYLDGGIG